MTDPIHTYIQCPAIGSAAAADWRDGAQLFSRSAQANAWAVDPVCSDYSSFLPSTTLITAVTSPLKPHGGRSASHIWSSFEQDWVIKADSYSEQSDSAKTRRVEWILCLSFQHGFVYVVPHSVLLELAPDMWVRPASWTAARH